MQISADCFVVGLPNEFQHLPLPANWCYFASTAVLSPKLCSRATNCCEKQLYRSPMGVQ